MDHRPRILVTRRWPGAVEQRLAERFDVVPNIDDRPMSQADLAAAMGEFDALCPTVSDRVDAAVIGGGGRVRLIASYGVGFDHIDIAAARAAGIAVTNTPGVLTDATADIAMLLVLMAARRAGEGERELRGGRWTGWRPTHMLGASLRGRTLGLVGFGRIAQATAKRAHFGFGMRIAYYSRNPAAPEVEARLGARHCETLAALLEGADVVSLHVPGGAETRHLIDRAALARMKPGAYLINTARGEIVDSDALAEALAAGRIAGAGLDVYPREPNVPEALLALENVVLLPHLGSATTETREAMGLRVLANLEAWRDGAALPNRVA
ncbi:MAG: D-glycerate dehydrogenase [Sphingomonas sp.]